MQIGVPIQLSQPNYVFHWIYHIIYTNLPSFTDPFIGVYITPPLLGYITYIPPLLTDVYTSFPPPPFIVWYIYPWIQYWYTSSVSNSMHDYPKM